MENKGNCVLGIDASLTHTGVAVASLTDGVCVTSRTCVPKTKGAARLCGIESWISLLLEELRNLYGTEIKMAFMEGYAFSPFGRTKKGGIFMAGKPHDLAELGGVIKAFLYKSRIPLFIVSPQTLKKWVTGSGKSDKDRNLLDAFKKWGVEFSDSHQCDAYALANIGWSICNIIDKKKDIKSFYDYEQEVLKVVMKQLEEK